MARTRKTVKLGKILFDLNRRLALSTCEAPVRQGMTAVVESLLHEADAYEGYGHLGEDDMTRVGLGGEKPGILYRYKYPTAGVAAPCGERTTAEEWGREKIEARAHNREPEIEQLFPDESRRHYYVAPALCADYEAAREAWVRKVSGKDWGDAAAGKLVSGPGTIR